MPEEYIEIVHLTLGLLNRVASLGEYTSGIARNIRNLGGDAHYFLESTSVDFPDVPKDTPIRLGGIYKELCVRQRYEELKEAGYSDVELRDDLCISWEVCSGLDIYVG